MKNLNQIQLQHCREKELFFQTLGIGPDIRAEFIIPFENGEDVEACATNAKESDWEHVSLYPNTCCPTYEQMSKAKDIFWNKDEIVFQVHPAKSEYVNRSEYELHLWRSRKISTKTEIRLRNKILSTYEAATKNKHTKEKTVEIISTEPRIVAIFGEGRWSTWEEVCAVKQQYWEPEEAAVQFNLSYKEDMNKEYCILLWDATDMILPDKELV